MELKVDIISKETIKPSSPTPLQLRNLKLSFLDQIAPGNFTPLIYFYKAEDSKVDPLERSKQLKKSLADTLTRYYPLAGTLVEDYLVECDDGGVDFIETRVLGYKLEEVIEKPDSKTLHQLLPFEPYADFVESGSRDIFCAIQLNIFDCGGLALGACISHKLSDGTTTSIFIKAWAATCRGELELIAPCFDGPKLFLAAEFHAAKRRAEMVKEQITSKRFVFGKADIALLKKQASSDFLERPPSRVESVSAFLWKRFMALAKAKAHTAKAFAAFQAVNLRRRMDPPLSDNSFGNLWWFAVASCPADLDADPQFLVAQMRTSIKDISSEFVATLQDVEKSLMLRQKLGQRVQSGEVEMFNFTSWCRFPVYDADFGWGKPIWICTPSRPYKNVVVLINTSDGEGIEAWVNLSEEDMADFELDPEMLAFRS